MMTAYVVILCYIYSIEQHHINIIVPLINYNNP